MSRAALTLFAAALFVAGPAFGHDWLTGKTDPETGLGCCNDRDCFPQPVGMVRPVDGGFLIVTTGEVIPASRVQWSPDGQYWLCQLPSERQVRCLFVPPVGS